MTALTNCTSFLKAGILLKLNSSWLKGFRKLLVQSKKSTVESLQSHFILTMSHWSSGLPPVASRHKGPGFKSPGGYLCETGILLLALSCYIGDPDVIDHFCGLVWGRLCPEPSLGPRDDNVIIPLDLTQLFCPGFTLAAGLPSSFTTDGVDAGGEPCRESAISLHSHHVSLVQWTTHLLLVTRDPGSNPQGGIYVKPGLSCQHCLATVSILRFWKLL